MITGFNHLTLAVSDLDLSCQFYTTMLGLELKARWNNGAYLLAGDLWICLSKDSAGPASDYTHYAFSVEAEQLDQWREKFNTAGVRQWKDNRSEGSSIYFLDPDGHKLELHVGDLNSRLSAIADQPYDGLQLFN